VPTIKAKERCIKEKGQTARRINQAPHRIQVGVNKKLQALKLVLLRLHTVLSVSQMDIGRGIAHASRRG
jgi:hypothetical protein